MALHLLCVGGEDHALRIPFLAALQNRGLRVSAAGTGAASAFAKTGSRIINISSTDLASALPIARPWVNWRGS